MTVSIKPPLSAEPVESDAYLAFLKAKVQLAQEAGFTVADEDINPILKDHHRLIVKWACAGGRRAIFAAFGLGKTVVQLEIIRLVLNRHGGRGLIVTPLGVRQEFRRDAMMLETGQHERITDAERARLAAWREGHPERAYPLTFIKSIGEAPASGICITNYEPVRDGKIDPRHFTAASLDEAACLRGFGGSKTFREFMRLFDGIRFKFVATATPSPNEYIELLAYSAFLEIMDVGQAKTRFFKRNSEKADSLTIHPHKEREFWLWVASWGLFVEKPSDLGCSDEGYDLPPMVVHWHELPSDHRAAGAEKNGQGRLLRNAAASLSDAAREKRDSIDIRIAKMMELRALDRQAHRILWHDLESERAAIEAAIPDVVSVYGAQDLADREAAVIGFSEGRIQELAGKAQMLGSGPNFQWHCHWAIFLGVGFKFNDFIQAVHRIYRFMQGHEVRIDLIYTEAERPARDILEAKWKRHIEQRAIMTQIIKEYGLSSAAIAATLTRALGVDRVEVSGEGYRLVNSDCVMECQRMEADSVDLIVTSIPFSTQYEYSPNYADFGHTDDNGHFWEQMDFLIPELLRVLSPGRVAAIHVKDRIVPGGMTHLGFQTVYPFSDDCIKAFQKHGFLLGLGGRIAGDTIVIANAAGAVDHVAFDGGRPLAGKVGNRLERAYSQSNRLPFDVVENVAIIPVEGSLIHKGGWTGSMSGETSYQGLQAQIALAAKTPAIRGVVFEYDSYGGEVNGGFETAQMIADLSKIKPTISILTDFAYSAGYLLASQSRTIVMPEFGGAGSIGVIILHADYHRALENEGIKVTIIRSGAKKADGNPYEPLPKAVADRWQATADVMREKFAGVVAKGRQNRITKAKALATEADVFDARDALALGLVDAVADPLAAFDAFAREVNRN